jgi:hypothetical protein
VEELGAAGANAILPPRCDQRQTLHRTRRAASHEVPGAACGEQWKQAKAAGATAERLAAVAKAMPCTDVGRILGLDRASARPGASAGPGARSKWVALPLVAGRRSRASRCPLTMALRAGRQRLSRASHSSLE